MSDFKEYELRLLFDLTLKLTKLRQEECKHLCIENAAPEILLGLIQMIKPIKGLFMHLISCIVGRILYNVLHGQEQT